MAGDLSDVEELTAALILVVMLGAAGIAAWRAAGRWITGDLLERTLGAAVLVLAQLVGIPLLLGMLGVLGLPAVLLVQLAVVAGTLAWTRQRSANDRSAASEGSRRSWTLLDVVGLAAASAYAVVAVGFSLRGVRSLDFDTKEYHITNLATWLQRGSIWDLPYAQPGSFSATHPGNGELLGLWLALPTHGDELSYAAPALFGVLAIIASAVLVRELRGGEAGAAGLGAVAAVAVLTAPVYLVTQVHSLSTDLPASSALVASVALLLVARRTELAPPVVLAGIALGLGLGAKYSAFVPAALIAAAAIPLLRRSRRWWWLVPGTVAFAAPWFARNLVRTGNPLFPQDLPGFADSSSPLDQLNTSMVQQVVHRHGDVVRVWFDLGSDLVGPVALALVAGVVAALVRRRTLPDAGAALWLAAVAVGASVAYLATPVTGGGPTGAAFIIASCLRYALVAVLLSTALWAGVVPRRLAGGSLAVVLAWNVWRLVTGSSPRADFDPSGVAIAGLALFVGFTIALRWATGRGEPRRWPAGVVAGAVAVVLLAAIAAVIHHNDRGRQTSELEALALSYGEDHPMVVVGVADLRALLGPRLERPLHGVARGGEAGEIPFADDSQLLPWVRGEPPPPADPALSEALDAAIEAAGLDLLAVGFDNPIAYPPGWSPAAGWCLVGGDDAGALYAREPRVAGESCRAGSA